MYTDPYNVVRTLAALLRAHSADLDAIVAEYQSNRFLTILEGIRKVVPTDRYPVLEIEPTDGGTEWATTRSQRPKFNFHLLLTVKAGTDEEVGLEYVCRLASAISSILSSPENIQLPVAGERKQLPDGKWIDTFILDGLVENVSYSLSRDGTMRRAEMTMWTIIHEPFADVRFAKSSVLGRTYH